MIARCAGVFFACALLGSSALSQEPPSTIHITGVVVDAQTSTPIRRARVDPGVTTTTWSASVTDQDGMFAVDVPRGTAALTFSKAGYAPDSVRIPPGESQSRQMQVSMHRAAVITGHLVDAAGTPLVNVNVTLRGGATRNTSTNDLGEFRFGGLASGEFALQAPARTDPVHLGPGDSFDVGNVVYEKAPAASIVDGAGRVAQRLAAISGTISDEYGEPVQGAFVQILRVLRVDDRIAALPQGIPSRMSDDRGSYRVFGLRSGRYLVVANVQGYADTYYAAGTNAAFAMPVVVDRADVSGVDITFRPERTARVSGTAVTSTGQSAAGAAVLLAVSQRSGGIMTQPKAAMVAPDGTFAFDDVPPGDYVVQLSAPMSGLRPKVDEGKLLVPRTEFAMQRLVIADEQPPPVLLRASAGTTIRGRVISDGITAVPRTLAVYPWPTDFDQSFAVGTGAAGMTRSDDGSFVITGVTGPRRFGIAVPAPTDNWYIKEARIHGVDALETSYDFGLDPKDVDEVEVVVSSAGAALSGMVTKPDGTSANDCAILVFSTDRAKWFRYSQSLRMNQAMLCTLQVNALPPGSYYALALSGNSDIITSGDWQNPATLEKLESRASRITLGDGEQRSVTLRLAPDP